MITINETRKKEGVKTFPSYSERILREGRIIDDWEQPEDMFSRIVREFSRIEREAFANAAL